MSAHVRNVPRPKPGPTQRVIQLKAGESIDCVILSPSTWGVGTHWNDRAGKHGRSERCTNGKGECSGCNAKLPCRWKGYLYVYSFTHRDCVFVELTPATDESIELQRGKDRPLRGERLKMRRGEGGNKTRIQVEVLEHRGDVEQLPPDKDPEQVLESLWNWRR